MKDAQQNFLIIPVYDEMGEKVIRVDTYVSLPILTNGVIWLHSSLCGATSTELCALREFLESEKIQDEIRELALHTIRVDALHECSDEYIGVPVIGYAYKIH